MSDDRFKRPPQHDHEDDNHETDQDVPFNLPKAEGFSRDDSNIHKDDTEDIVIPTSAMPGDDDKIYNQRTVPYDRQGAQESSASNVTTNAGTNADAEEIAKLHASDQPLRRGLPEDESILYRAEQPEEEQDVQTGDYPFSVELPTPLPDEDTIPPPNIVYQGRIDDGEGDSDDVPFHLPPNDGSSDPGGPVGNKFVTMPHDPASTDDRTLPGSGGLDPNPDFANMRPEPTIQNPKVRSSPPQPQPTVPSQSPRRQTPPPPQQHVRPAQPRPAPQPRPNYPPQQQQPGQSVPQRYAGAPPVPPGGQRAAPGRRRLPKRRRRNVGCLAIFIGLFLTFCGGTTLLTAVGGALAYARVGELLNEQLEGFDDYTAFQSTFLYDRDGRQLFEIFNEGRRTQIRMEDIPQDLIDATIAIEDDSFYDNIGIDIAATTVAFLQFVGASPDENTPGGSTITQQLVRNVLFDPEYRAERSAQRKAEEILLAIALTGRKSKDEILELYLNEIYYGNLAYGAQAASQVFFDKDVSELTLGEAALLAGLPQAPAELDPLNPDPDIQNAVNRRWRLVLQEMVDDGFINEAQRDEALSAGLAYNPQDIPLRAPHFTVYAQRQLEREMTDLGYSLEDIAAGGWHVYTTVDLEINDTVQQIAAQQVAGLVGNNVSNAAVVVLNPITGEVLAMVGSVDYNNDAIDGRVNVTTAVRQPGSTMKPFTYSAALEQGWRTGDVVWDTRVSIGIPGQEPYVPRNYDGGFHGPLRIRQALANSYNIPAVQVLRYVGVDYLLQFMQRFGAESLGTDASRYGLSLTLGGGEISPLELTRAYGVFANNGALVDTQAILCILDNDDNIIFEYEGGCPRGELTETSVVQSGFGEQVLDPRVAFFISDVMADNNARTPAMGSNSPLNTGSLRTSVKTGTTNDIKDNWTVGYTSNMVVGVWVGNNNGDPMVNSSGLTGAAPIWNRVITALYASDAMLREFAVDGQLANDQLVPPAGMTYQTLCDIRNLRDGATGCGSQINEWVMDSPIALPDGSGGLDYPAQAPSPLPQPTGTGFVEEVQPGIYRSLVFRLNPALAAGIQLQLGPDDRQPPTPIYCRATADSVGTPGVQEQWFIAPPLPPATQSDAAEAEQYARNNNLAFLPIIDCTPELIAGGVGAIGGTGGNVTVAVITQPQPNQTINRAIPILGTAQLGGDYYKLEVSGGEFGANNWVTIGNIHEQSVVNGQLETLPGWPDLDPGSYLLQLVVVRDGNYVQDPYIVPFNVQAP